MAIQSNQVTKPTYRFIIPTYNSGGNLARCLGSILHQDFTKWTAVVIDDKSTDNSLKGAASMLLDKRIDVIENPKRFGATYSRYRGIHHACKNEEDVCLLLDGDDWLEGTKALTIIDRAYQGGAEATHGSYLTTNGKPPINTEHYNETIQRTQSYRESKWKCQPLRTFKYKYFRFIASDNFKDSKGDWFTACTDLAIMFPVLEQVEYPGFVHIPDHIYRYDNKLRNLREHGKPEKMRQNREIRNKNLKLINA